MENRLLERIYNNNLPQAKQTPTKRYIRHICDLGASVEYSLKALLSNTCSEATNMPYVSFCELTLAVEQNYYLRLKCFGAQTDMFRHIDSIMKPRNLSENPQIFPHSVLIQPNPAIVSPRRDRYPIFVTSEQGLNASV